MIEIDKECFSKFFNVPLLIQGHVKISAGAVLGVSENRLVCMQTPNQYDYTEDGTDCQDIVNMTDPAQLAYWGNGNMGAGFLFEKGAKLVAEGAGTKVLIRNNVGGAGGGLAARDPATSVHVTAGAEIEISGNTALAAIGGGGLLLYNRATV